MPSDHAELRRLAEAATPGPWHACHDEDGVPQVASGSHEEQRSYVAITSITPDAEYIAAASPAVVLALLDAIERLEAKTWKCGAQPTADPPQDCDMPFCGCNPAWQDALAAAQESGWLSEREARELRVSRDSLESTISAVVQTIGGTVEGRPTSRINFLQRLRELRAIEARRG